MSTWAQSKLKKFRKNAAKGRCEVYFMHKKNEPIWQTPRKKINNNR